jgi:hypothetical protein
MWTQAGHSPANPHDLGKKLTTTDANVETWW